MRTTLDIADDVLQAAKEPGRRHKKTAGQVISELARAALSERRGRPGAAGASALSDIGHHVNARSLRVTKARQT